LAETTHTGLDRLAEMELEELCWWCRESRRYLETRAEAMREEMERAGLG
jgi:hypothetical protein